MNMSKQLKVSCDLNKLLVCHLPKDVVEVGLTVRTEWGKHALIEDWYNRTEDWIVRIHSKRRRMPHHGHFNDEHEIP